LIVVNLVFDENVANHAGRFRSGYLQRTVT
jgi:hypothetical protein